MVLTLIIVIDPFHAQNGMGFPPCGTDDAHQHLLQSSSSYFENQAILHAALTGIQPDVPAPLVAGMPVDELDIWTLPVVVHVFHLGSPEGNDENISDAQIISAIDALNDDFRKIAGTNGDGDGVDVRIEFELAQRDPNGAPSSGIVRVDATGISGFAENGIASSAGYPGVDEVTVKSFSSWDVEDYINVFVVPEINGNDGGGGVQGFAFIGPTGDVRDGITVLYNAFGTVGTLKPGREKNRTLTHEMGHYLTLLHPFWNTSSCSAEGDCAVIGDEICDTPTTLENGSCSDAACPGALLENYMDYAPTSCRNMFTAGQRDRMRTCLSTVRSGLLESDGGIPVVASDLQLQPLGEYEVCSTFWEPQLRILNQGTSTMQGGEIAWSINGVAMPNVAFDDVLLPDETAIVFMPPTPLPVDTSEWIFAVRLAEGSLDEYNLNDSLVETVFRSPGEAWTLTFTTDFFGVDLGWSVTDTAGLVVWERSDYPIGSNTYIEQGCLQTGCYTLELTDADGDGFTFGGSMFLENEAGDTLALIPASEGDFGSSISFDVCTLCASSQTEETQECHDFNLNGLCDENEVAGCTYPVASNYNEEATMDDGSCALTCRSDLSGDGVVQVNDLLDFLLDYGLACEP